MFFNPFTTVNIIRALTSLSSENSNSTVSLPVQGGLKSFHVYSTHCIGSVTSPNDLFVDDSFFPQQLQESLTEKFKSFKNKLSKFSPQELGSTNQWIEFEMGNGVAGIIDLSYKEGCNINAFIVLAKFELHSHEIQHSIPHPLFSVMVFNPFNIATVQVTETVHGSLGPQERQELHNRLVQSLEHLKEGKFV